MRNIAFILCSILAMGGQHAFAADPAPKRAAQSRAECQAALDRVEDLASSPVVNVSLSTEVAAGLVEGLALCRSGHTEQGALLVHPALQALHPVQ